MRELAALMAIFVMEKPRTKRVPVGLALSDFLRDWAKSEGIKLSSLLEEVLWIQFQARLNLLPPEEREALIATILPASEDRRGEYQKMRHKTLNLTVGAP